MDTAIVAGGLATAQLLLWLVLPWWTRVYTPSAFAALALWTALGGLASTLISFRYEALIVPARDEAQSHDLFWIVVVLALVLGGLGAFGVSALPAAWREKLDHGVLGSWLPIAMVGGAASVILSAFLARANREGRYVWMTGARVLQAAVFALVGGFLASDYGDAGLLIASLIGSLAGLALLIVHAPPLRPASLVGTAWTRRDAPLLLWPSSLLDVLSQQLPFWLIGVWYSVDALGQYGLVWRVLVAPLLALAAAASPVFARQFSRAWADGHADRAMLRRWWLVNGCLGACLALPAVIAGPQAFTAIFGFEWSLAGELAAPLGVMAWAMFVSTPTSTALLIVDRHRWAPSFGLAMVIYRFGALALGASQDDLLLGLWAWTICEMVAIVVYNRLIWQALSEERAPCAE